MSNEHFIIHLEQVESGLTEEIDVTKLDAPTYRLEAVPDSLDLEYDNKTSFSEPKAIKVTSTKTLDGNTMAVGFSVSGDFGARRDGEYVVLGGSLTPGKNQSGKVTITQDESGKTVTVAVSITVTKPEPEPEPEPEASVYRLDATPRTLELTYDNKTSFSEPKAIKVTSTKTVGGNTTAVGFSVSGDFGARRDGEYVVLGGSLMPGKNQSGKVTITQDESGKTVTVAVSITVTKPAPKPVYKFDAVPDAVTLTPHETETATSKVTSTKTVEGSTTKVGYRATNLADKPSWLDVTIDGDTITLKYHR